jgi:uncharacterized coiled-coil protein SlyX
MCVGGETQVSLLDSQLSDQRQTLTELDEQVTRKRAALQSLEGDLAACREQVRV